MARATIEDVEAMLRAEGALEGARMKDARLQDAVEAIESGAIDPIKLWAQGKIFTGDW